MGYLYLYEQRSKMEIRDVAADDDLAIVSTKRNVERWERAHAEYHAELRHLGALGWEAKVSASADEIRAVTLSEIDRHFDYCDKRMQRQHVAALHRQRRNAEAEVAAHRRAFPGQSLMGYGAQCAALVPCLREAEHAGRCALRQTASKASTGAGTVSTPRTSRASRPRERRDGSRRHSTRGGTGDDPAPEPDPEHSPPPNDGRRFCACGCGLDISHRSPQAKHFNDSHKKAKYRHPDGGNRFEDPYLTLSAADRDALQAQALAGCRCNGHHILDGEFGDCVKCGRPYRDDIPDRYLQLWEQRDRLPSYIRAVSYDRDYRVMA